MACSSNEESQTENNITKIEKGKRKTGDERNGTKKPSAETDGKWGWVIVASSLVINVLVDGIITSYGVLLPKFADFFNESKSNLSLIGTVMIGTYLCIGPFSGSLVNRYGCRIVTVVGSIIASVGILAGSFCPNLQCLIGTYGLIGGTGFGMMYLSSIVSVSLYFKKKRALATGIVVCGSGIGTFIFSPFLEFLSEEYDWRNILMIMSGLILNGAVCGMFIRPISPQNDIEYSNNEYDSVNKTEINKGCTLKESDERNDKTDINVDNVITFTSLTVLTSETKNQDSPLKNYRNSILRRAKSLEKVFHLSLFKNSKFLLLFIGSIFGVIGYYIPFIYLVDRALELGISSTDAAFLLSIIGIMNIIGRVAAGILANTKTFDALVLTIVARIVGSISLFLQPFCTTYKTLIAFCVVFGACTATYVSCASIIVCNIVGVDKLASAWGLLGVARGFASIVGPYLAGLVYEKTGSYNSSFYIGGATFMLAAIFHLAIWLTLRFTRNKRLQLSGCTAKAAEGQIRNSTFKICQSS